MQKSLKIELRKREKEKREPSLSHSLWADNPFAPLSLPTQSPTGRPSSSQPSPGEPQGFLAKRPSSMPIQAGAYRVRPSDGAGINCSINRSADYPNPRPPVFPSPVLSREETLTVADVADGRRRHFPPSSATPSAANHSIALRVRSSFSPCPQLLLSPSVASPRQTPIRVAVGLRLGEAPVPNNGRRHQHIWSPATRRVERALMRILSRTGASRPSST
jgi:hypothetical protein